MMHRPLIRFSLAALVLLVAIGATLLVLHRDPGAAQGTQAADGDASGGGHGTKAANGVWRVGDAWTVKVRENGGAVTPNGAGSTYVVTYRFAVQRAPKGKNGAWEVRVRQPGAEGPFADGWLLWYRESASAMTLTRVAAGPQDPLPASMAPVVLGAQFPYELTYTAPPRSRTLDARTLVKRAVLPPTAAIPNAASSGARPPAAAPKNAPSARTAHAGVPRAAQ